MNVIYVMGRLMKAFNIDFRFLYKIFQIKTESTNMCTYTNHDLILSKYFIFNKIIKLN